MGILQFFGIIWARRFIILAATVASSIAAFLTVLLVEPRYEAEARVMLDVIKPDPVTGQVMRPRLSAPIPKPRANCSGTTASRGRSWKT